MTFRRELQPERKAMTSLEIGDFRADGSWDPKLPASGRGPRYRFMQSLVRARRAAHLSPAQIAEQIEASPFAGMFSELEHWKTVTAWDHWFEARTRSSADETVKRCGIGAVEHFHWEGGECVAGEDTRRLPMPDPAQVRQFVDGLVAEVSRGKEVNRRISDQQFFEGKET